MPILYDYPRAPSPRRARILLAEKGIAHETKIVDLAAGEHQSEAYRAVNPGLTVPALVLEDGTCLLYTSPSPRDKRQSRMPSSA